MSLWLQVRRTRMCLLTMLVVVVTLAVTRGWSLGLPNMLGGAALLIPIALLLPLAVAIAVAAGLTMGDPALEVVASRPLPLLDAVYASSAALFMLAVGFLMQHMAAVDLALEAGRNAVGYMGLTLIGRRIAGMQTAAILPVAFATLAALFSSSTPGETHWWAWHIATMHNRLSWWFAGALLLIGIGMTLMHNNVAVAQR